MQKNVGNCMPYNILSFTLCGDLALFKKNDTNDTVYISYNFIHKPVILGILGAVLGIQGYAASDKEHPRYYQELKSIKIAIIPSYKKPLKKVITGFNNASGIGADMPEGGAWQIREQILVGEPDIEYRIYLLDDNSSKHMAELKKRLANYETEYPLYYGKNEFFAYYKDFAELEAESYQEDSTEIRICSLFHQKNEADDPFKEIDFDDFDPLDVESYTEGYTVYERLPVGFDENGFYCKKLFVLSDKYVKTDVVTDIYQVYNKGKKEYVQFI